jgi:hypothetical protein
MANPQSPPYYGQDFLLKWISKNAEDIINVHAIIHTSDLHLKFLYTKVTEMNRIKYLSVNILNPAHASGQQYHSLLEPHSNFPNQISSQKDTVQLSNWVGVFLGRQNHVEIMSGPGWLPSIFPL